MRQLIDISALASCYKEYGPHPLHYLYRLIMPAESTAYNLLGNTVNNMFDAAVSRQGEKPEEQFNQVLRQSWHEDALLYLTTDEDALHRRYFQTIGQQYQNVRQVVDQEFPRQGIDARQAWLEPSFICPELGLSGRMDLLSLSPDSAKIIELKSGKMNEWQHQPKQAHRIQTLLYAELLHRCLGLPKEKIGCYLHYNTYPLLIGQQFTEELLSGTLELRQQIADILHDIAEGNGRQYFTHEAVEGMYPTNHGKLWLNHDKPQLLSFIDTIQTAPAEVREWFFSRLQFIMREEELKVSQPEPVSLRNLCLTSVISNDSSGVKGFSLSLNGEEHDFRTGDPVLLYPMLTADTHAWGSIILRGSISAIEESEISVALRHEERSCHFDQATLRTPFALEHDNVNSSISQACRSLYRVLAKGRTSVNNCRLIIGPPGTGKTSITLRNIVLNLLTDTDQRVLLLAFTHRAVDEICETLDSIFVHYPELPSYLRLGTTNDTPAIYHSHLLQQLIDQCPDRKTLRQAILQNRFWVGTTARLQATIQLFELLEFDTIIVDEASQLLDFQVLDLLQRADKEVILIGDPKQLPAVTLQAGSQSLFELMYRQGVTATLLDHQGRMHPEIAQLANQLFYGNQLLPVGLPHQLETQAEMPRVWFFNVDSAQLGTKANPAEARKVAEIVHRVWQIYAEKQISWSEKSLGIIVPYRQQIAAIRRELELLVPQLIPLINIDTVERYQGSQRDVIIYTTTVSTSEQLCQLSAPIELDDTLIDRKLNVAITRARKHLFIVGNQTLLSQSPVYQELLSLISAKMSAWR